MLSNIGAEMSAALLAKLLVNGAVAVFAVDEIVYAGSLSYTKYIYSHTHTQHVQIAVHCVSLCPIPCYADIIVHCMHTCDCMLYRFSNFAAPYTRALTIATTLSRTVPLTLAR